MLSYFKADSESLLKELLSDSVNENKVKSYINKGVDINAIDDRGKTILFQLAFKKKFNSIKLLIKLGVDLYKEDNTGATVLSNACEKYDFEAAKFLLQNGYDINSKNSKGRTVLQELVRVANLKAYSFLQDFNPDFDSVDNSGKTVLFDAVLSKNLELVEDVVKKIKDINVVDNNGQNALFYSVLQENLRISLVLMAKGININAIDKNGQNVLYNAVLLGHRNKILLNHLIDRRIDLGVVDNRGMSIVDEIFYITTLQKHDKDITDKKYLIINQNDNYISLAEQVLGFSSSVNSIGKDGKTTLQKELEKKNFAFAEILIRNKADIEVLDEDGRSILHQEILKGFSSRRVVDFLLVNGANVNQVDNYGKSILENLIELYLASTAQKTPEKQLEKYVQENGDFDFYIKKILAQGVNVNLKKANGRNILYELVNYSCEPIINTLVEYGVDVNCVDENGITPIAYMVEEGLKLVNPKEQAEFLKNLQLFLKYKVSLDIQDKDGRTVIHKAVIADNLQVVEKLMIKKANLDIKDNHGRTALHHTQWKGNYEIARWLISAGANLNETDNSGFNILNYAAILGHIRLVITLISSGALLYNKHQKNKKIAQFFKSKERVLDKYLEATNISDDNMRNALSELVMNFRKEINEAL
ncbi:hypothetical protein DF188_03135 [Aliarcobacter skirrowii]|uniref:Uncharacterized protein n=1 Tax=Aliarcobacter skirrowii TaxID=28200 RepID=A0A2U2C1B0_9BACT|nr:ankyrin repeat domain-containing protein [Aliarcobacter skirrowii]PWE22120.1 hypothetical protein DF188_03135 [Aliarcobacter skirrowii]